MPLSKEALRLLATRIGYRTEAFRGSGERDAKKVLAFEWDELGNIAEKANVASALGIPLRSPVVNVFHTIDERFGNNAKVIWLATAEGVKGYTELPDELIDSYKIPSNALLIIDLAEDGQLFLMSDSDYRALEESMKVVE